MPTDSTQQFIQDAISGISQINLRDRDRVASFKTVKGSVKDDSTPVSHMATRYPTFQQTSKEENSTPIPTFYQQNQDDFTPLSQNGNKNASFLQVPEDNNYLSKS